MEVKSSDVSLWPILIILGFGAVLSHLFTTPPIAAAEIFERLGNPAAFFFVSGIIIAACVGVIRSKYLPLRNTYVLVAGLALVVLAGSVTSLVSRFHR